MIEITSEHDCRYKSLTEKLAAALKDIKKHQEIVMGDTDFNVKLSSTWQIADKALSSGKDREGGDNE